MNLVRLRTALATCLLLTVWSISCAGGAEAQASAPPRAVPGLTADAAPGTTGPAAPSPFALTISPTRIAVAANDIGSVQRIQVSNSASTPVAVVVQKRSFTAQADGTLVYQDEAPYSASSWLTPDVTSFDLAVGATRIVTATITAPANPEAGDHQAALVFLVPAGATTDNVKVNRGIAVPIFITAPGDVDDSATISALSASGFATGGPVAIGATINDTGTVHRDFRGSTHLTVEGAGTAVPFPDFTVVRGATRDIATTWDPPLLCICHPSVSFVNADGTVQTASVTVIVFPLGLVGGIVLAGGLLFFAYRLAKRRYRSNVVAAAAALSRPVVGDA